MVTVIALVIVLATFSVITALLPTLTALIATHKVGYRLALTALVRITAQLFKTSFTTVTALAHVLKLFAPNYLKLA